MQTADTIRKIIRNKERGISELRIIRSLNCSKGTIYRIWIFAKENAINSEILENIRDDELLTIFYPSKSTVRRDKQLPDFKGIHERIILYPSRSLFHEWTNYKKEYNDGYEYSRFCTLYKDWCGTVHVRAVMLTNEPPGECIYIDWAGETMTKTFPGDNEPTTICFFVTTIGASAYPYVEPFRDMKLTSYIKGHINALRYYGGVPAICVPDNCKTAVIRHQKKEFILQRVYEEMQDYYGYTVLPARPRSPTDKNDVEAAVKLAEDWIISELKEHIDEYEDFEAVRNACSYYLEELVHHEYKHTKLNRREWFYEVDFPMLAPLPPEDFKVYEYKYVTVGTTYHVSVGEAGDDHLYSVPYIYINQQVMLKYSYDDLIVVDSEHKVIASWERSHARTLATVHTLDEHRPPNHQIAMALKIKDSDYYQKKAAEVGPYTYEFIRRLIAKYKNPNQSYRACMGIISKTWKKGNKDYVVKERMERACREALSINSISYSTVMNQLKMDGYDKNAGSDKNDDFEHENLRGNDAYQ